MTHEIAELLPFYLNGTLDGAEQARVEAELANCARCAAELAELRVLDALLRERAANATTPALTRSILARTRGGAPWWSAPARYAAAAAIVFAAGGGAFAAYHAVTGGGAPTAVRAIPTPHERLTVTRSPQRVERLARDATLVVAVDPSRVRPELHRTIPTPALDATLARYAALGTVRSRRVIATDLEPELRALDVRAAALEAEVRIVLSEHGDFRLRDARRLRDERAQVAARRARDLARVANASLTVRFVRR